MKNNFLIAAIILVVALVSISIWSDTKATRVVGPNHVSTGADGKTLLLFNHTLYKLDGGGEILWSKSFKELGLEGAVSDVHLLPDGAFILADFKAREVKRFNSFGDDKLSFDIGQGPADKVRGSFKVAMDPEMGDFYVADTSNHRVEVYGRDGGYKRHFGSKGDGPKELHFPNQLAFGPDGLLYIADTNNHRISVWTREGGTSKRTLMTVEDPERCCKRWPAFFVFIPDSRMVVLNMHDSMTDGAPAIVHMEDGLLERISVPRKASAMDVASTGEELIVADEGRMKLLRFSFDGEELDDFGGDELKGLFEETLAERNGYRLMRKGSLAALFVILILAIAFVIMERMKDHDKMSEKGLLDEHMELRPGVYDGAPFTEQVRLAVMVIAPMLIFMAVGLFFIEEMDTSEGGVFFITYILVLSFFVVFGVFRSIKKGAYLDRSMKIVKTALIRHSEVISMLLHDGEKIRLYMMGAPYRLGVGFFRFSGRRTVKGFNRQGFFLAALLIFTDRRMIVLRTGPLGFGLKGIESVGYGSIKEISKEAPRPIKRISSLTQRLQNMFIQPLFIDFTDSLGNDGVRSFNVQVTSLADAAVDEFSERKEGGERLMEGAESICRKCLKPISTEDGRCAACVTGGDPARTAMFLSMLYPGLGQFKNDELGKGLTFLLTFSLFFFFAAYGLVLYLGGKTEMDHGAMVGILSSAVTAFTIWLVSVYDANKS